MGANGVLGDTWTLATQPAKTTGPATSTSSTALTTTTTTTTTIPTSIARATTSTIRAPSPAAATTGVTPGTTTAALGVTAHTVHVGSQLTLSGGGFVPVTTVDITFQSTPIAVASVVTDNHGHFSVTVLVPGDAPAGQHHFVAEGRAARGGVQTLMAPVNVTMAGHHHSLVLPVTMVVLTVLLAGAAAVVLARADGERRLDGMG
jgi:hypothetical protein